jgi:hypothetical protein
MDIAAADIGTLLLLAFSLAFIFWVGFRNGVMLVLIPFAGAAILTYPIMLLLSLLWQAMGWVGQPSSALAFGVAVAVSAVGMWFAREEYLR